MTTIRVERTRDYADIFAIAKHPRIWPHWSDGEPLPEKAPQPVAPSREYWLVVKDDEGAIGCVRFVHQTKVAVEGHFGFLPRAWGLKAFAGAQTAHAWLFGQTPYRTIIGFTPAYNRLALRFARRLGYEARGLFPDLCQSGDMVGFVLRKDDWLLRRA